MLESIVFLVFMLLPAGWLLRDWKFSDKRTNRYRNITKALLMSWLFFGSLSTYYYWKKNNENEILQEKIDELLIGKNDLLGKTSELTKQIEEYQEQIITKNKRIDELEKQARILRSIEGHIECLFRANWTEKRHPGRLTPVSWNKAQFYVRIFDKNVDDASTILFYLNSVETTKLSDFDLGLKLTIKADLQSGPFGQELDILRIYGHLMVHIPFIYAGDTIDDNIVLKDMKATFVINGEKKIQMRQSVHFDIPIPQGGKLAVFQLNKNNLFNGAFDE